MQRDRTDRWIRREIQRKPTALSTCGTSHPDESGQISAIQEMAAPLVLAWRGIGPWKWFGAAAAIIVVAVLTIVS